MNYHIAVIPGDGIGPEIVGEAKKVLNKIGEVYGHTFEYEELLMGGCSIDAYGEPLTEETLERAKTVTPCFWGPSAAMWGRATGTSCHQIRDQKQGFLRFVKGWGCFVIFGRRCSLMN